MVSGCGCRGVAVKRSCGEEGQVSLSQRENEPEGTPLRPLPQIRIKFICFGQNHMPALSMRTIPNPVLPFFPQQYALSISRDMVLS